MTSNCRFQGVQAGRGTFPHTPQLVTLQGWRWHHFLQVSFSGHQCHLIAFTALFNFWASQCQQTNHQFSGGSSTIESSHLHSPHTSPAYIYRPTLKVRIPHFWPPLCYQICTPSGCSLSLFPTTVALLPPLPSTAVSTQCRQR